MNAIADASSLIVLAHLDALWLLSLVFGAVALVPEVEIETVVHGKAGGYPDAERIEAAISGGHLVVTEPTRAETKRAALFRDGSPVLSRTDCLTLACAAERGWTLIMEDRRGRNAAAANDIAYVTIQVLPLQGLIDGHQAFEECDDLLVRIGQAMRTDEPVLVVLRTAANEIRRLRTAKTESSK